MVTVLRLYFFTERMHRSLLGQGMQSLMENLIFMTWLYLLSMAGVQLMLCLPSGQVATPFSTSMENAAASKPVPSRACHL